MQNIKWAFSMIVCVVMALCCLGEARSSLAQGGSGELTGLVTDPTGAVIPNVNVTLKNNATGALRETVSTDAGLQVCGSTLSWIGYTLRVSAPKFKTFNAGNIVVTVGRTVTVDVHLELGAVSECSGSRDRRTACSGDRIANWGCAESEKLGDTASRNPQPERVHFESCRRSSRLWHRSRCFG